MLPASRDPRELLASLPDAALQAVALECGVDPSAYPSRESLIEAIAALPDRDQVLAEADRRRVESGLEKLRTRELRELGERHGVSLHGLSRKSDIVEALAGATTTPDLLVEIEARRPPSRDFASFFGKEPAEDFERVEQLLGEARERFEERRFVAALAAAQEASRIAGRTTRQLRRSSWSYAILSAQALLEPCDPLDPAATEARRHLDRVRDAFLQDRLEQDALLEELVRASEAAHGREAERIRDALAQSRDAIREAANLGASVALAEDAWKRGADFLDRGQLAAARESLSLAMERVEDARSRRIRDVEVSLRTVAEHIGLARNVGADVSEAEALVDEARAAIGQGEHGRAGDLLKRAERLAIKGQQRQIDRAIQLRASHTERALAIIASCEPVLQEAETYDLNAADVRILLRQARDVVMKGDYLAGLTLAQNAEEAARRLRAQVAEERRRRGIEKPRGGICGVCRSNRLTFRDDGWGLCSDCGSAFRWRGPLGVWERLKALLGT